MVLAWLMNLGFAAGTAAADVPPVLTVTDRSRPFYDTADSSSSLYDTIDRSRPFYEVTDE